jgi:hypothetical protein
MRLFYSNGSFYGGGLADYLRGFVRWVWLATFLISLSLFLMLFSFIAALAAPGGG